MDSKTGGVQSPSAGVLGSHDSVTGAPENYKGEAVEKEAGNFVNSFASIALSSASGKKDHGNPDSDPLNASLPDPTDIAVAGADAKDNTAGGSNGIKHDKTKQPMEDAMWTKMRPIMHVVGDAADGWERFAKYAELSSDRANLAYFPSVRYLLRLLSRKTVHALNWLEFLYLY